MLNLYTNLSGYIVINIIINNQEGIWVLFGCFLMFSNFYRLDLYNETHVALANLTGWGQVTPL